MQILRFYSDDGSVYTGTDFDGTTASPIDGDLFSGFRPGRVRKKVAKILPPVQPPAVFCIGLNYRRHAMETGLDLPRYPVVFMKNPSAVTGHGAPVEIPLACTLGPEVDYEAELCAVVGKPAKHVSEKEALDVLLGYTCANDISARKWQMHAGAGQWVRSKSFDTFCPIGPWITTTDEIPDPNALEIRCRLNGRTMQESSTSDMIFSVAKIISYLSESTTLLPGTLILTGTPSGVGYTRNPPVYLAPGDLLETEISRIGTLKNGVINESASGA